MRKWIMIGVGSVATLVGAALFALMEPEPSLIVDIEIHDRNEFNVYPPGERFTVDLTATVVLGNAAGVLGYQWVDHLGNVLTNPEPLDGDARTTIRSPFNEMPVGYYGLRFLPEDAGVLFNPGSGLRRELGFAVLPLISERKLDVDSPFGIVHFSYRDPYLDPGWMKTATEYQIGWDGSRESRRGWRKRLEPARKQGQMELPIILGDVWKSGSTKQVRRMMREIFRADPKFDGTTYLPAYELGIEENLGGGSFADRLERSIQKIRVTKEERDQIDPSIKLAYQIANLGLGPYRAVMESGLGAEIDILSVHPYPWSDWPSPDDWHDEFVDDVRRIMAENGVDLPLWYTEVGSVQNDADVLFMYSGSLPVGDGQTRAEYAAYLVKLHAHALDKGIGKVFWYNYKDRGASTTDAEAHFGLRDHWGFPKPGYLAYAAMLRCMKNRTPIPFEHAGSWRAYRYAGESDSCVVAWMADDERQTIPFDRLLPGLSENRLVEAFDLVGGALSMERGQVELSTFPVFLVVDESTSENSTP